MKLAMQAFKHQSTISGISQISGKQSSNSRRSQGGLSVGTRIETLYKMHEQKMRRTSQVQKEQQDRELQECTFQPNKKRERLNRKKQSETVNKSMHFIQLSMRQSHNEQPSKIERNSSFQNDMSREINIEVVDQIGSSNQLKELVSDDGGHQIQMVPNNFNKEDIYSGEKNGSNIHVIE